MITEASLPLHIHIFRHGETEWSLTGLSDRLRQQLFCNALVGIYFVMAARAANHRRKYPSAPID